jgi:hypothetical protein
MPILKTVKNVAINKKITQKMFLKKEENIVFSISIVVWQSFGYFGGILWQLVQQFQNQHKIQLF